MLYLLYMLFFNVVVEAVVVVVIVLDGVSIWFCIYKYTSEVLHVIIFINHLVMINTSISLFTFFPSYKVVIVGGPASTPNEVFTLPGTGVKTESWNCS